VTLGNLVGGFTFTGLATYATYKPKPEPSKIPAPTPAGVPAE
jgi:formate transporter